MIQHSLPLSATKPILIQSFYLCKKNQKPRYNHQEVKCICFSGESETGGQGGGGFITKYFKEGKENRDEPHLQRANNFLYALNTNHRLNEVAKFIVFRTGCLS